MRGNVSSLHPSITLSRATKTHRAQPLLQVTEILSPLRQSLLSRCDDSYGRIRLGLDRLSARTGARRRGAGGGGRGAGLLRESSGGGGALTDLRWRTVGTSDCDEVKKRLAEHASSEKRGRLTNTLNLSRSMACAEERREGRRYTSEQARLPGNGDRRIPDLEPRRECWPSDVGGGVETNAKRVDVLDEIAVGTEGDAAGRGAVGV